jgi:hypothetical protein
VLIYVPSLDRDELIDALYPQPKQGPMLDATPPSFGEGRDVMVVNSPLELALETLIQQHATIPAWPPVLAST